MLLTEQLNFYRVAMLFNKVQDSTIISMLVQQFNENSIVQQKPRHLVNNLDA